ncbi:MAG: HupE/UreJ family protein [Hyphomicrobiaceae bacterium]
MSKKAAILSIALLAAGSAPALAHPGHSFAFSDGLMHPISGVDHLLAMVAVGFWSTAIGSRAMITLPSTFVLFMMIGALAVHVGAAGMPATELMIVMSLLVLGGAIAARATPPLWLATGVTALFALVHGLAHGMEVAHNASFGLYVAGFVASTALLHVAGVILAMSTRQQKLAAPLFGAFLAIAGTGMLAV